MKTHRTPLRRIGACLAGVVALPLSAALADGDTKKDRETRDRPAPEAQVDHRRERVERALEEMGRRIGELKAAGKHDEAKALAERAGEIKAEHAPLWKGQGSPRGSGRTDARARDFRPEAPQGRGRPPHAGRPGPGPGGPPAIRDARPPQIQRGGAPAPRAMADRAPGGPPPFARRAADRREPSQAGSREDHLKAAAVHLRAAGLGHVAERIEGGRTPGAPARPRQTADPRDARIGNAIGGLRRDVEALKAEVARLKAATGCGGAGCEKEGCEGDCGKDGCGKAGCENGGCGKEGCQKSECEKKEGEADAPPSKAGDDRERGDHDRRPHHDEDDEDDEKEGRKTSAAIIFV